MGVENPSEDAQEFVSRYYDAIGSQQAGNGGESPEAVVEDFITWAAEGDASTGDVDYVIGEIADAGHYTESSLRDRVMTASKRVAQLSVERTTIHEYPGRSNEFEFEISTDNHSGSFRLSAGELREDEFREAVLNTVYLSVEFDDFTGWVNRHLQTAEVIDHADPTEVVRTAAEIVEELESTADKTEFVNHPRTMKYVPRDAEPCFYVSTDTLVGELNVRLSGVSLSPRQVSSEIERMRVGDSTVITAGPEERLRAWPLDDDYIAHITSE